LKWRYGIIKFYYNDDLSKPYYGLGEIYYDKDNKPYACTEKPITFVVDLEEEDIADIKKSFNTQLQRTANDCLKEDIFDTIVFINKKKL